MQAYSKPILGLSAIQSATFAGLFQDYQEELAHRGTFPVEDKLIAGLSGRKLSGVNPWEDPTNSGLAVEDS